MMFGYSSSGTGPRRPSRCRGIANRRRGRPDRRESPRGTSPSRSCPAPRRSRRRARGSTRPHRGSPSGRCRSRRNLHKESIPRAARRRFGVHHDVAVIIDGPAARIAAHGLTPRVEGRKRSVTSNPCKAGSCSSSAHQVRCRTVALTCVVGVAGPVPVVEGKVVPHECS